jgi:hypothetical protein
MQLDRKVDLIVEYVSGATRIFGVMGKVFIDELNKILIITKNKNMK